MIYTTAILVYNGPRRARYFGLFGPEVFDPARAKLGIKLALAYGCPIIFAGDANGGSDLRQAAELARAAGVQVVIEAYNGTDPAWKNTRGDARAAARVLDEDSRLAAVDHVQVVSDAYHVPRGHLAMRRALDARFGETREIRLSVAATWRRSLHGIRVLPGELRGALDYAAGNPQRSRGKPIGKPDLTAQHANA